MGVVGGRTVWEGKRDGGLAPGGMPMGLCMDHDAVGGCGLSDEHEGWSSAVLRRRRAGGERGCAPLVAVRWLSLARGGVDDHVCWRGRSGAETVCRLQRAVNGLCS